MAANEKRAIRTLNRLHKICVAGERGFEAVARNVSNRGLKVLLKSYAQQRAHFAEELKQEVERLGGDVSERSSIRGVIHRGRIDIRAGLTIGPHNVENAVLSEAALGEKSALKAYQGALNQTLPAESRAIVERQAERIAELCDRIDLLRGHGDQRLVVRLFDTEPNAQTAVQALEQASFDPDSIETVDVTDVAGIYESKGGRVGETVVSGAIGGAVWGSILGAAAGLGILIIASGMDMMMEGNEQRAWALVALSGTVMGALFGVILGFLIGQGITEEDAYLYDDSVRYGTKLVRLVTDNDRAVEAARIMHQINAAARAQDLKRGRSAQPSAA